MLVGIAASQDCKLSPIARALNESILLKKTEERLSHHLADPQLGRAVQEAVVEPAAPRIWEDSAARPAGSGDSSSPTLGPPPSASTHHLESPP